jgi:hypothetical protein
VIGEDRRHITSRGGSRYRYCELRTM